MLFEPTKHHGLWQPNKPCKTLNPCTTNLKLSSGQGPSCVLEQFSRGNVRRLLTTSYDEAYYSPPQCFEEDPRDATSNCSNPHIICCHGTRQLSKRHERQQDWSRIGKACVPSPIFGLGFRLSLSQGLGLRVLWGCRF